MRSIAALFFAASVIAVSAAPRGPALGDGDRVYKDLGFQLWQQGIARYTEDRIGTLAATGYTPTPVFAGLPDFTTYGAASQALIDRTHAQLTTAKPGEDKRSAFYPVGAAEGLLLDRVKPGWRAEYTKEG